MIAITSILSTTLLLAASTNAAPTAHQKRIAQSISDSTTQWQKAGGAEKCRDISLTAFTTLLAAGKNRDQQDSADAMIDLAKTLNNDPDMIRLAQIFVQQPRNASDSLQVPYCQTAPRNAELNGIFHCQFQGTVVNGKFSCRPALNTPVTDGVQLNTLVTSPGTAGSKAAALAASAAPAPPLLQLRPTTPLQSPLHPLLQFPPLQLLLPQVRLRPPILRSLSSLLNAKFAGLTAGSSCNEGDQVCVAGGFAQCVARAFVSTPCAVGTQCFALPLVNKAGTSITCSTEADATARIAATGVSGGITGA
ncbi:hypothetical protein M422DRAFT_43765 [Sphaerobolus stellatus SS14]|nr:hypothetical protein M422DRAFT_43765 [Sphaerobolus stellatus SS14]